jgi:hypothetical protein
MCYKQRSNEVTYRVTSRQVAVFAISFSCLKGQVGPALSTIAITIRQTPKKLLQQLTTGTEQIRVRALLRILTLVKTKMA